MHKFTSAFILLYLFVFVFVKAQEVSVTSNDIQVIQDGSVGMTGLGVFVIALFAISIISFGIFWVYKEYLFAALRGELGTDASLQKNERLVEENIGEHEAKLISEVEIHDVTDNDASVTEDDNENTEFVQYENPQMYIENVSGEPMLVIK